MATAGRIRAALGTAAMGLSLAVLAPREAFAQG